MLPWGRTQTSKRPHGKLLRLNKRSPTAGVRGEGGKTCVTLSRKKKEGDGRTKGGIETQKKHRKVTRRRGSKTLKARRPRERITYSTGKGGKIGGGDNVKKAEKHTPKKHARATK